MKLSIKKQEKINNVFRRYGVSPEEAHFILENVLNPKLHETNDDLFTPEYKEKLKAQKQAEYEKIKSDALEKAERSLRTALDWQTELEFRKKHHSREENLPQPTIRHIKLEEGDEPSEEEKQKILAKLFARSHGDLPPAGAHSQTHKEKFYQLPSYVDRIRKGDDEESHPIHHPSKPNPHQKKKIEPEKPLTDIPLESVEGPELTSHSPEDIDKMHKELSKDDPETMRAEKEKQDKAKHAARAYLEKLKREKGKLDEGNLDVDPEQLKIGIGIEKEHTSDPVKAEEIALDHLREDPHYYTKLKKANLQETSTFSNSPKVDLDAITNIMQSMRQEKRDRYV